MGSIKPDAVPTRRALRSGVHLRRRWHRVDRLLTAGIGAAAVTAGLYLGVTAPASSPVQPPAAAAAVTMPQVAASQVTAPRGAGEAATVQQSDLQHFGDHHGDGGRRFDGGRR